MTTTVCQCNLIGFEREREVEAEVTLKSSLDISRTTRAATQTAKENDLAFQNLKRALKIELFVNKLPLQQQQQQQLKLLHLRYAFTQILIHEFSHQVRACLPGQVGRLDSLSSATICLFEKSFVRSKKTIA